MTNPNREQAREVLARAFRYIDNDAGAMNGSPNEGGQEDADDLAIDLADTLMVDFSEGWPERAAEQLAAALPTPEAERVEIPAGMVPWAGGDSAPADWDGGPVLCDDGQLYAFGNPQAEWCSDIVAYTPRPTTDPAGRAVIEAGRRNAARMGGVFIPTAGSAGDVDLTDWLRGDWYEKWQDATENADDELMATLEALRGRVERTIRAALRPTQDNRDVAGAEAAWREGWAQCKASLTEDEAFCLTEDVEQDAWLESDTRRALPLRSTAPVEASDSDYWMYAQDDLHATEGEA